MKFSKWPLLCLTNLTFILTACGPMEEADKNKEKESISCTKEIFYADLDGDAFGDPNNTTEACEQPEGYQTEAGDCDDTDAAIHPDGQEVCDGVDNNCNGLVDDADTTLDMATTSVFYRDADGDSFGDANQTVSTCQAAAGYVDADSDCDDGDAAVYPGATEICDDKDNDCDNLTDDLDDDVDLTTASSFYLDEDGDGFGAGTPISACDRPGGYVAQDGDCDDADSAVYTGADEICDGLDNDCDGGIDGTAAAPNQCTGFAGTYSGTYSITAAERLGSTTINQMDCSGAAEFEIDLTQQPALQGTVSCSTSSSLGHFDQSQTGTIEGDIAVDGTITGRITHVYNDSIYDGLTKSYAFSGATGDPIEVTGDGTLRPHPQSAVPWEVDFTFSCDRQ